MEFFSVYADSIPSMVMATESMQSQVRIPTVPYLTWMSRELVGERLSITYEYELNSSNVFVDLFLFGGGEETQYE